MKKRIQNYLSGNNEGFSLVELIIVIAIMAILIGVVALAVIPNLERSRESKDLSTLDTACSALSVAVANAGAKAGDGTIVIDKEGKATSDNTDVLKLFEEQADPSTMKLGCSICSGDSITLTWKTKDGANTVMAAATTNGKKEAKYAKGDDGKPAKFTVTASQQKGTTSTSTSTT